MNELITKVKEWGKERGLLQSETKNPFKQLSKLVEEVGEMASTMNKNQLDKFDKEAGDVFVTLIILCYQLDKDPIQCLRLAHEKNNDRTGRTIEGTFIKKEDL